MKAQQRFRPPDLFHDEAMDVARWLANEEPTVAVTALLHAPAPGRVRLRWFELVILLLFILLVTFAWKRMTILVCIAQVFIVTSLVLYRGGKGQHQQRGRWLREQLLLHLERGGRSIPLSVWIEAVQSLGSDRRKAYDAFARRLSTATMDELQALTQEERAWLREPLKEWPGEALQTALLLALGTAGDIFAKPYARRLVRNPDESETVREAAEECLRSLERTG